mmetsp:Transcript_1431/g.2039  ORF Transcript_1431/g.2039 Transcript_1431/m.2039 type:complete len:283 (+) Transcript_1431:277-1125(+)
MGIAIQACVFDPPYHRCCYPLGQCLDSTFAFLCCYERELPRLPENYDCDHNRVLERKTAGGHIFHIWEWRPVKYVRRWVNGKPYYTNLPDDHSTWDRPSGFGGGPKAAKFHVIYSHGRREDMTLYSPRWRLQKLAWELDANCYMYEWPGYGEAPGIPTQNKVFDSIRATYNYLTEEKKVDPKTIILYGMSLGTGPTLWLASQVLVGGVVLQSGFTSICRVLSSHLGCKGSCLCCLPKCSEFCDLFDNLNATEQIQCPVYVMHSKSDEVIVTNVISNDRPDLI